MSLEKGAWHMQFCIMKTMTANEALQWRYATKRMTSKAVPENTVNKIIEAIHFSPSSLGLQPYEVLLITNAEMKKKILPIAFNQKQIVESSHLLVFVAWDKYTDKRIDNVFDHLAKERNQSAADVEGQKSAAKKFFSALSEEAQFYHAAKQAGIALGIAVLTAAIEGIDASSMEGFNPAALDELLGLKEKGLRSTALLALGYRDVANDWNYKLKKVRKPLKELITTIK